MRSYESQTNLSSTANKSSAVNRSGMMKSASIGELGKAEVSTGVANIPNQIHYHHSKRKIHINIMLFGILSIKSNWLINILTYWIYIIGETGLGKTGFINNILGQPIFNDTITSQDNNTASKTQIRIRSQEIEESGSRALLSIVDLPEFGGKQGKKESGQAAISYIEDQSEASLREESQLRRQQKDFRDTRIHTILYFHNPNAHKLSQLDISLIGRMSRLANVLVVIAKGDTLLRHEYLRIKNNMRDSLHEAGITTFQPKSQDESTTSVAAFEPFICVSGVDLLTPSPARNYHWGSLKVTPSSSPASLNINGLSNLLFKDFLPDLILETQSKYEFWKAEIIHKTGIKDEEWKEPADVLNKISAKLSQLKMNV